MLFMDSHKNHTLIIILTNKIGLNVFGNESKPYFLFENAEKWSFVMPDELSRLLFSP